MNVETFLLCDAATDSMGKLNILGAFDTIGAPSFPLIHPQCSVAVRLRLQRIEKGTHKFKIHAINDDGKFLVPAIDGEFNIQIPDTDRSGTINVVLNLQNLKFDSPGGYAVVLIVDEKEISRLPLQVKKVS